jgi:hypothetical protein
MNVDTPATLRLQKFFRQNTPVSDYHRDVSVV